MSTAPYHSPGEALRFQAETHADHVAVSFPQSGQSVTYGDWWKESKRVAEALIDLGVRPGDPVALLAQNRVEWPIVQLAIALTGGLFVPLNTHLRRDDLAYALTHSKSKVLFLSSRFRSQTYLATVRLLRGALPDLEHLISLDRGEGECLGFRDLASQPVVLPEISPETVGALLYTSGTTGFPKGALLSHRAMLYVGWQVARRLQVSRDDRWTSIIPLFHCAGCIMNLLGCVLNGARYVGIEAFDPVAMFQVIQAESCTVLSGVPTSYFAMLEHAERAHYDLTSLRTGTCGGADANPEMLQRCAVEFPIPKLCNVYGQTESATIIACPDCDDPDRFTTAGMPLEGTEVRITDPHHGTPLPIESIGQIEARGPLIMDGYHHDPNATAAAIDSGGWLKTGDLGRLTRSGKLQLAGGRLRDMIIRGGENIYPVEIENCLLAMEGVDRVAVFAMPDEYYGEIVAAGVCLSKALNVTEMQNHCAERLARFKVPAVWFRVEDFPLTASGKVRKVELQEQAVAGKLPALE